jgi:hypothetical protein
VRSDTRSGGRVRGRTWQAAVALPVLGSRLVRSFVGVAALLSTFPSMMNQPGFRAPALSVQLVRHFATVACSCQRASQARDRRTGLTTTARVYASTRLTQRPAVQPSSTCLDALARHSAGVTSVGGDGGSSSTARRCARARVHLNNEQLSGVGHRSIRCVTTPCHTPAQRGAILHQPQPSARLRSSGRSTATTATHTATAGRSAASQRAGATVSAPITSDEAPAKHRACSESSSIPTVAQP